MSEESNLPDGTEPIPPADPAQPSSQTELESSGTPASEPAPTGPDASSELHGLLSELEELAGRIREALGNHGL